MAFSLIFPVNPSVSHRWSDTTIHFSPVLVYTEWTGNYRRFGNMTRPRVMFTIYKTKTRPTVNNFPLQKGQEYNVPNNEGRRLICWALTKIHTHEWQRAIRVKSLCFCGRRSEQLWTAVSCLFCKYDVTEVHLQAHADAYNLLHRLLSV